MGIPLQSTVLWFFPRSLKRPSANANVQGVIVFEQVNDNIELSLHYTIVSMLSEAEHVTNSEPCKKYDALDFSDLLTWKREEEALAG